MASTYTVKQGDHLSAVAAQFGFTRYETIWDHPNNAALKKKRLLPHVLLPGDELFIPDKQQKTEKGATGQVHRFVVSGARLEVRLVLTDFDNQPLPGLDCELEVEGAISNVKSNAAGLVFAEIPVTAHQGVLRVSALDLELPIKVGHLDPLGEDSGWHARLANLGYLVGPTEPVDIDRLAYAVEEFQCDHKLKVTGEIDAATRAALEKGHGV